MKIFMGTEFSNFSITITFQKDDGQCIALKGEPNNDCVPIYGCTLNDGEEKRLMNWLNEH
jgi:hypothetical protein